MSETPNLPQAKYKFSLKRLTPKHKEVAALLAQGLKAVDVARIVGFTPEYLHMLSKQPLFIEYIDGMNAVVDRQLEALYGKSVEVIADALSAGGDEALKAARLQMEATNRVGKQKSEVLHKHEHSLVAVLTGLPPARRVQILNNQDDSVVSEQ